MQGEYLVLNKLDITGPLNKDFPRCVLMEISESHFGHVKYDTYATLMKANPKPIRIKKTELKKNFDLLVRYVNPNCHWKMKDLMKAIRFNLYIIGRKISMTKRTIIGRQRPGKEETLDCCILYNQCRIRHIKTNRKTKLTTMIRLLYMYETNDLSMVRNLINKSTNMPGLLSCITTLGINLDCSTKDPDILYYMNKKDLCVKAKIHYSSHQPTYEELRREIIRQESILPLRLKRPKTKEEAICSAAIEYGLDISSCEDPLKELKTYSEKSIFLSDYMNKRLKTKYKSTNSLFLGECFNAKLPMQFYTNKQIIQLLNQEGIDIRDKGAGYTMMQSIYLTETFYEGKVPFAEQNTAITFDELDNLKDEEIICYGTRNAAKCFEVSTLLDAFKSFKCFRNPLYKEFEQFDEKSMTKLQYILSHSCFPMTKEKQQLLNLINTLSKKLSSMSAEEMYITEMYKNSTSNKEKILSILNELFRLSMFMRGWDGTSPYPIGSAPVNNQHNVDVRVRSQIIKFENICSDQIGSMFIRMRLYRWNNKKKEYYRCFDDEMGKTIKERLDIVKEAQSVYSCIRLTSNWFACSYCRYMEMLNEEPLIDVTKIRSIS